MDLKIQNGITLCWGTPILIIDLPNHDALNAELKTLVLEKKKTTPGIHKSNFGGWHSGDDLLTWPAPAVKTLREWIIEGFRRATKRTGGDQSYEGRLQITCWANVNGPGHSNDIHNHPQCAWSGVYYVDAGMPKPDEEKSGFLHFLDPRAGAGMVEDPFGRFGKGREFKPRSGQMILFPSWLLHGVRPYRGEGERISIAFNISLLDLM